MTAVKSIKNEQWTVDYICNAIKNKEIIKDKYQRPKKWLILKHESKASIREYIDFLQETLNSVHAITFGKQDKQFANIDGNNRLNAIMFYLEKPFDVYPEYLDNIKEFIKKRFSNEIHDELIQIFSKLSYNEIIDFQYQLFFEDSGKEELYQKHLKLFRDDWEDFFYGSKKKNIKGFQKNFKIKGTINFNEVKININLFEGYSNDELNDIYLQVNTHNSSFTEIELLAGRLYNVTDFKISNNTIKNNIEETLCHFYKKRSEKEVLECYEYKLSTMNAYDFIVGYQNNIHNQCNMIEEVDNSGLSLFFKIWKTLYKNFDDTFTTANVNNFIEKIEKTKNILNDLHKNLFPDILADVLFKNSNKKETSLKKNNIYVIIMVIIGYLNHDTSYKIIIKSIEKCILYHFFVKDIANKDEKEMYKIYDTILYEAGGKYIDNVADKMLKTPTLISDKITRDMIDKVINILITQSIKNGQYETRENGKDKKDRRRSRPYHEIVMLFNYFRHKVPCEYLSNKYWVEHIIPFSSEWDGDIDTDRFGNIIPIIDKINKKRGNKNINEYSRIEKDEGTQFIKFLNDIIPSKDIYNSIVSHKERKPMIINNEMYNTLCSENENKLKMAFIHYLFAN
jgi:hypothetical protein